MKRSDSPKASALKIEMWPIEKVKEYAGNPRLIPEAAIDAVAQSILQFGWRQPIVVDTKGEIVAGHTRYKAALKLGLKMVPVHVTCDLTPAQIKAYRLADNATNSWSEWNMDLLPIELRDLQGMDFNLDLLGFSADDLASMLSPEGAAAGLTDPDAVPEPPAEPVTKRGDLWLLGRVVRCPKCRRLTDV